MQPTGPQIPTGPDSATAQRLGTCLSHVYDMGVQAGAARVITQADHELGQKHGKHST